MKKKTIIGTCRACLTKTKLVGVYCPKCMSRAKEARIHEKQTELFHHALDYGAGDLWRNT